MRVFFTINVLMAFLWMALTQTQTISDFLVGFVLSLLLLALVRPEYGVLGIRIPLFLINFLWQVLVSATEVARIVLSPTLNIRPAVIAIPLDIQHPVEIATLASVITLTPGTMSVDIGRNQEGQQVLFVHALTHDTPDELRARIKGGFEHQILQISGKAT